MFEDSNVLYGIPEDYPVDIANISLSGTLGQGNMPFWIKYDTIPGGGTNATNDDPSTWADFW